MPEFRIVATVSNPYDGLSRLLGDAERFGFQLISANLETNGSSGRIEMCFGAGKFSCDVVSARLSRHPCISQLKAIEADLCTTTETTRKSDHG